MDRKRRNTSSPENDSPPPKRSRQVSSDYCDESEDDASMPHEHPRIDSIYGQKGAFPGLGGDDDEIFYGPASDGLEYLRMVRSEARSVPRLLVASDFAKNTQAEASSGGYFDDDAYIATSLPTPDRPVAVEADAQEEYHRSLLLRLEVIRTTLKCTPPLHAISALPPSRPISCPPESKKARATWKRLMLTTEPSMVQLACMDMDSTLRVIGFLGDILPRVLTHRDVNQIRNVGAWVWGCLGRCRDVGQLTSEDVAELRELGKVAVANLVAIRDGIDVSKTYEIATGHDDGDEDQESNAAELSATEVEMGEQSAIEDASFGTSSTVAGRESDAELDDLEQAKRRLRSTLMSSDGQDDRSIIGNTKVANDAEDIPSNADTQRRAILDMIITIVGEKYGQRDLLEFRDIWDEVTEV